MGIFGIAKKGFGLLKKSKKGIDPKKRLKTFKAASEKQKGKSDLKKLVKDIKAADERITKFSDDFMKKSYSKSKVNKYLTKEYKKQQRKP